MASSVHWKSQKRMQTPTTTGATDSCIVEWKTHFLFLPRKRSFLGKKQGKNCKDKQMTMVHPDNGKKLHCAWKLPWTDAQHLSWSPWPYGDHFKLAPHEDDTEPMHYLKKKSIKGNTPALVLLFLCELLLWVTNSSWWKTPTYTMIPGKNKFHKT